MPCHDGAGTAVVPIASGDSSANSRDARLVAERVARSAGEDHLAIQAGEIRIAPEAITPLKGFARSKMMWPT
jgi:hypothetical protein